jgi:hypothetical protein
VWAPPRAGQRSRLHCVHTEPMSGVDFDPLELTVDASLNDIVIGDFGCPDVKGLRADRVCSRDALLALAADCGLPGLPPDRLSDSLARAAASTDAKAKRAAHTALWTYGRRLGALIATLRDPAAPDDHSGTSARRAFLAHWLTIDTVWLAGGLMAGRPGHIILEGTAEAVAVAVRPCRVLLNPYPAVAPLLGVARRAHDARDDEMTAVADLGHTSIRTAVAERSAGTLRTLRVLDVRAAPSRGSLDEVEDAVAAALVSAVKRAIGVRCDRLRLIVSVASYVTAGVPVASDEGIYGGLGHRLTSLHRRLTAGSDLTLSLEFVHDGTAAAASASSRNSATITAGTWLGVGFNTADGPPLLRLEPDLQIHR